MEAEEDKVVEEKISHLLLSTPGTCFLCLKDNDTTANDEDLNDGIIDLNNICSYLNINQPSLLKTSLKNDEGSENIDKSSCTFSVTLCPNCRELTGKLDDFIGELERVKLMVNCHLNMFHKVLEGDEGDWEGSLEWINLLGRMHSNPSDVFKAKLVQMLRKEAQDKAFKILKKAVQPEVAKVKAKDFPVAPSRGGLRERSKVKILLSEEKSSPHQPPPPKKRRMMGRKTGKGKIKKASNEKQVRRKVPPGDKGAKFCTICEQMFPNIGKLRRHQAGHHPEQLVLRLKPDDMEDDQFRGNCQEIFGEEMERCGVGKGASKIFNCGNCPEGKTSYKRGDDFVVHWVLYHWEVVEGIFRGKVGDVEGEEEGGDYVIIQGEGEEDGGDKVGEGGKLKDKRGRRGSRRKPGEEEGIICKICEVTFSRNDKLKRHLVHVHPEQLFLEGKPGWMGEEELRGRVKGLFEREVKEATYGKPGAKIFRCGYCKEGGKEGGYKGQIDFVIHLAYVHKEEMEEKLGEEGEGSWDIVVEDGGGDEQMEGQEEEEEMLYPDMALGEGQVEVEEGAGEEVDHLDEFQKEYGYLF